MRPQCQAGITSCRLVYLVASKQGDIPRAAGTRGVHNDRCAIIQGTVKCARRNGGSCPDGTVCVRIATGCRLSRIRCANIDVSRVEQPCAALGIDLDATDIQIFA